MQSIIDHATVTKTVLLENDKTREKTVLYVVRGKETNADTHLIRADYQFIPHLEYRSILWGTGGARLWYMAGGYTCARIAPVQGILKIRFI